MLARSLNLLIAVAAASLAAPLLLNYPLGFLPPTIGFLLVALVVFLRIGSAFVLLPAILPIIGLAPWTGWIAFEEIDLLILAAATGGYARLAFEGKQGASYRPSILMLILATVFSASVVLSMVRGFADAGGFAFGWFQSYDGPMNSIRVGKSFFLALLLLPLLTRLDNRQLSVGMALGLATASLAALWERLAFTDLLNFSSDYRTTALFWEMHVGGAALDGWLLLTFPFGIWFVRNSRRVRLGFALGLLVLAAYAALTTFSRGVYLALAVSIPLLAWQTRHARLDAESDTGTYRWPLIRWVVAVLLLATMTYMVFPSGGYRALLALLGVVVASLPMLPVLRSMVFAQVLAAGLAGLSVGGLLFFVGGLVPRGTYAVYVLLFFSTLACLSWHNKSGKREVAGIACLAGYVGLAVSAASIANHWGGNDALVAMCGALFLLVPILSWGATGKHPLWPNNWRWQGSFVAVAVSTCAVVSVFAGGAYMGNRFAASASDFENRISHWRHGMSMLQSTAEFLWGKGLGRFPANYYFAVPNGEFPGTYRVVEEDGNQFISLVSSRHPIGFGNILRISQRLDFDVQGPFRVAFKARAKSTTDVHFEVCSKHLLYAASCAIGQVTIKPTNGQWRPVDARLNGAMIGSGPWYAPRIKMFSFGIAKGNSGAEVDDVELTSVDGRNLLANGDFSEDMRYWFFSSDRDHLPWHAKSLWLNLLFDQGIFGLMAFVMLTVSALWRLNAGKAREHELSPYLTAAILGFQVVGLFDSLTDAPRVAFAYYLLVLYAHSLGKQPESKESSR